MSRFKGFSVEQVECGGCHTLVTALKSELDDVQIGDDALSNSIRSMASIQGANDTLKIGNNTIPTISPRDKRRIKVGEEVKLLQRLFYSLLKLVQNIGGKVMDPDFEKSFIILTIRVESLF